MYKSPPTEIEVEEAKDDFPTNENEWMDANDFFNSAGSGNNGATQTGSRAAHLAFEETPGCKRSSIIRIRTEKKGSVSNSPFHKSSRQRSGKNLAFENGNNDSYTQTGSRAAHEETPPGCKRESIMRICVENKGIVPSCTL